MASEDLSGVLRQELEHLDKRIQEFNSKKQAILNLLKTYSVSESGSAESGPPGQKGMNTLEMAQSVLRAHGTEMKPEEIREAIRAEFALVPAPTLSQMLYTRARRKKTFYRNPGGRFGLIEWLSRGRQKKAA